MKAMGSPTLIGLTEAPALKQHGVDLTPALLSGQKPDRSSVMSTRGLGKRDQWYALRGSRYTYVERGEGGDQKVILWDNNEDPLQERNVASDKAYKAVTKRMAARLKQEKKRTRGGKGRQ